MGKPFRWQAIKFIYMMLSVAASLWALDLLVQIDPKNKVILEKTFYGKLFKWGTYFLCTTLFLTAIFKHVHFRRRFVEKMVYNTQTEEFMVVRRSFWGGKFQYPVSRYSFADAGTTSSILKTPSSTGRAPTTSLSTTRMSLRSPTKMHGSGRTSSATSSPNASKYDHTSPSTVVPSRGFQGCIREGGGRDVLVGC